MLTIELFLCIKTHSVSLYLKTKSRLICSERININLLFLSAGKDKNMKETGKSLKKSKVKGEYYYCSRSLIGARVFRNSEEPKVKQVGRITDTN